MRAAPSDHYNGTVYRGICLIGDCPGIHMHRSGLPFRDNHLAVCDFVIHIPPFQKYVKRILDIHFP